MINLPAQDAVQFTFTIPKWLVYGIVLPMLVFWKWPLWLIYLPHMQSLSIAKGSCTRESLILLWIYPESTTKRMAETCWKTFNDGIWVNYTVAAGSNNSLAWIISSAIKGDEFLKRNHEFQGSGEQWSRYTLPRLVCGWEILGSSKMLLIQ